MTDTKTSEMVEKERARRAVRTAIKQGRLIRPSSCEDCGQTSAQASDGRSTIHAHHHRGYAAQLDVQWLCAKCHFKHDPRPSGEANGRAKLTAADVTEIRRDFRPNATRYKPAFGMKWLGRKYGVSDLTIQRIVRNEIWTDEALR